MMALPFVDIHCHLLPSIDDGASSLDEALAMARMAVADGIGTVIATPHQLGAFGKNRGESIRQQVATLQQTLHDHEIPLKVLPGADVRIDEAMLAGLKSGDVLSLGDHRRHVLLELPHELYLPVEPVLQALGRLGMAGILSHPERNRGLQHRPDLVDELVDHGLMQITAGSLQGSFGPACQHLAESMIERGLVHFVATDAHGSRSRRPRISEACTRISEIADERMAIELCAENPARVARGEPVSAGRRQGAAKKKSWFWFARVAG